MCTVMYSSNIDIVHRLISNSHNIIIYTNDNNVMIKSFLLIRENDLKINQLPVEILLYIQRYYIIMFNIIKTSLNFIKLVIEKH